MLLSSVGPASWSVAASATPAYTVVSIPLGTSSEYSYSTGINDRGDVVGGVGSNEQVPFLYRSGRAVRLTPPAGVVGAEATGINNSDVISIQAHHSDGEALAFAVRPRGHGFTWTGLSTGRLHCENVSVANVAQNGDIDGGVTLDLPHGVLQLRSVIWRAKARGTYSNAEILPISHGFRETVAGGIWNRKGVSYVAGAQGDGGAIQEATLWSPAPRMT